MREIEIFFIVIIAGLALEFIVYKTFLHAIGRPFKINHKHSFGKHISLASIPMLGFIAFMILGSFGYVKLFIFSAVVGTLLEYCLGRYFHKISGQKIWTYNYASIGNYTSYFSIPYWGFAGVFFYFIAKLVGI